MASWGHGLHSGKPPPVPPTNNTNNTAKSKLETSKGPPTDQNHHQQNATDGHAGTTGGGRPKEGQLTDRHGANAATRRTTSTCIYNHSSTRTRIVIVIRIQIRLFILKLVIPCFQLVHVRTDHCIAMYYILPTALQPTLGASHRPRLAQQKPPKSASNLAVKINLYSLTVTHHLKRPFPPLSSHYRPS